MSMAASAPRLLPTHALAHASPCTHTEMMQVQSNRKQSLWARRKWAAAHCREMQLGVAPLVLVKSTTLHKLAASMDRCAGCCPAGQLQQSVMTRRGRRVEFRGA